MLFSNLLLALSLTVLWPLVLLGLMAGCAWLERRTLAAEEAGPRRLRRPASAPSEEESEAVVLLEQAVDLAVKRRFAADQPADEAARSQRPAGGGGRHLRRANGSRAGGRHERRR
jgi:uncharacterized iron-regulated membrane protein